MNGGPSRLATTAAIAPVGAQPLLSRGAAEKIKLHVASGPWLVGFAPPLPLAPLLGLELSKDAEKPECLGKPRVGKSDSTSAFPAQAHQVTWNAAADTVTWRFSQTAW